VEGTLIIKGLLDPQDARAAADLGASGIVVSNHGGRQLDGVLSSSRALPAIADAVGDRLTVLADSGVRSGLDVVRMLASGAKAVLLGRAWVYALAADGERGVRQLLEIMAKEMRVAMTLTGVSRVSELGRSNLATALPASLEAPLAAIQNHTRTALQTAVERPGQNDPRF
jgi:L-lactate dehydrogenase (cytochrome)